MEMINTLAPELARSVPGELKAAKLPKLRAVIQIGGPKSAGHDRLRRSREDGARPPSRDARGAVEEPAVRRSDQHPVHQRHHRLAEGRHAHAPQHPQQRLFRRPRDGADRERPDVHPGAALSLLRHGDGQPHGGDPRRGDGLSGRGVRSAGDADDGGAGEVHDALRRADHVHRRARASGILALQSLLAADGHHGRRAVPDRGHAQGHRADEHARRDHRLRHDRDQPGQLPDRRQRQRSSGGCRRSAAFIRTPR